VIQGKLFWLSILSAIGGTAFAINHWFFGEVQFAWKSCIAASVCGAIGMAVFSRTERLPVVGGILPGLLAGGGAYGATAAYVFFRESIRVFELLLPSVLGAFPGVLLYIITVRVYYAFADRGESE